MKYISILLKMLKNIACASFYTQHFSAINKRKVTIMVRVLVLDGISEKDSFPKKI